MGSPFNDYAEERDQEEYSKQPHYYKECKNCGSWSPKKHWKMFGHCSYCGKN